MRRFVLISIALFAVCAAIWGCSTIIGLQAPPPPQDAGADDGTTGGRGDDATVDGPRADGAGKEAGILGAACHADIECSSGHCADSVCCESACSGTCETCNLNAASAGTCKAIPSGMDPDKECVMVATDSGAATAADANSPADDGSSASDSGATTDAPRAADAPVSGGDASGEAGESDGGTSTVTADSGINLPEGGVTSTDKSCAGSCNGQRACAYPDNTKTCGTQFCNSASEAAGFVCDGAGSCTLGLRSCTSYSCMGSACGTSCAQTSDCTDAYYCDGPQHKCQPKLGNGIPCALGNQCQSGFCTTGVCCTSDCNIPGGTCKQTNAIGECKCMMDCGDGGACMLYYQDADGDGYGNKDGTVAAGTAKVGCSNGQPPAAGFVADHSDCDDGDPNAHPGQTAYFGTKSIGLAHTFDYNCDGMLEKQTPEFAGGCEFCSPTPTCGATSPMCTTASEQSAFSCGPRRFCRPIVCRPGVFCPPPCTFGGCYPYVETGFAFQGANGVDCGATATATTCGTCANVGLPASATQSSLQQLCH